MFSYVQTELPAQIISHRTFTFRRATKDNSDCYFARKVLFCPLLEPPAPICIALYAFSERVRCSNLMNVRHCCLMRFQIIQKNGRTELACWRHRWRHESTTQPDRALGSKKGAGTSVSRGDLLGDLDGRACIRPGVWVGTRPEGNLGARGAWILNPAEKTKPRIAGLLNMVPAPRVELGTY